MKKKTHNAPQKCPFGPQIQCDKRQHLAFPRCTTPEGNSISSLVCWSGPWTDWWEQWVAEERIWQSQPSLTVRFSDAESDRDWRGSAQRPPAKVCRCADATGRGLSSKRCLSVTLSRRSGERCQSERDRAWHDALTQDAVHTHSPRFRNTHGSVCLLSR